MLPFPATHLASQNRRSVGSEAGSLAASLKSPVGAVAGCPLGCSMHPLSASKPTAIDKGVVTVSKAIMG